jgi:hypothetical protein
MWTVALGKILMHDNLQNGVLRWLNGVVYVRRMGNPSTIFYFIVKSHANYGVAFFPCLG